MKKFLIHCDNYKWCGCYDDFCAYSESEIDEKMIAAAEFVSWDVWNDLAGGFQSLIEDAGYDSEEDVPSDKLDELMDEEQGLVYYIITEVENENDKKSFELLESDNKLIYDARN